VAWPVAEHEAKGQMSYFLVQRTEWKLVEAANQLEALRAYDKGSRMHAETECTHGPGTLGGDLEVKTWLEAWHRAEGLLMR
jgi:hypothetical protein